MWEIGTITIICYYSGGVGGGGVARIGWLLCGRKTGNPTKCEVVGSTVGTLTIHYCYLKCNL